MLAEIRRGLLSAAVMLVLATATVSLPLWFGDVREMVVGLSPEWYLRWLDLILGGGLISGGLFLTILVWDCREWWTAGLARGARWILNGAVGGRRLTVTQNGATKEAPGHRTSTNAPPLELLGPPAEIGVRPCPQTAQHVTAALKALGVPGCQVVRHYAGPVVQVVQVRLPETVKPTVVTGLAEDLAVFLGARAVTITSVVGAPGTLQVELSGGATAPVPLRALLDSRAYRQTGALPLVIGADAKGAPLVVDLVELPHLLIAGASGSGKSTFLRQLLIGLVYRLRPSDLELVLIDPKLVELSLFASLPHVRQGVITTAAGALQALQDLMAEMERRYESFRAAGVTGLDGYNRAHPGERLPWIIVMVDELAALMESDLRKQLEPTIQALAQKARACGIHLVVATQRPSVDVITGTIKTNIPARVSLRLPSNADSRTILDVAGAERLRPKGDLYYRPAGELVHGQAAAVPDEMARAVVEWWTQQADGSEKPREMVLAGAGTDSTPEEVPAAVETPTQVSDAPAPPPPDEDPELRWVKEYALQHGHISRRIVERGLGIASARAQVLVKALDDLGWLLPARAPHPRMIRLTPEERREQLAQLRGVVLEEIQLEVSDSGDPAQGAPAGDAAGIDLRSEVQRADKEVAKALVRQPVDPAELRGLAEQLDTLIDRALDAEDPDSFHTLAAGRRCVKAHIGRL